MAIQPTGPAELTRAQLYLDASDTLTLLNRKGYQVLGHPPGSLEVHPDLASWVAERAARYELDELRGFLRSRGVGV